MTWYEGKGTRVNGDAPSELPVSPLGRHTRPEGYLADEGLVDAVNVALRLGQPLLLTGQPGTGKTQLAHSLAWELGFGSPLKFETKSTSQSSDLFYTYDALGRFNAAQAEGEKAETLDYLTFNALGRAILYANDPDNVRHLMRNTPMHEQKRRSVVLIDEIDKAPRDFPNDLLNEIEGFYFRMPEFGNETVTADPDMRPVLVLTSNSEKNLPEAFLRRCIFYDLPFPDKDPERLVRIIASRLGEAVTEDTQRINDAVSVFLQLRRDSSGLLKKPSTSELLAWLHWLTEEGVQTGKWNEAIIEPTLASLVKTSDDRDKAREVLEQWLNQQGQ